MKNKIESKQASRRQLLTDCNRVYGDTNGDCAFDVEDVQYLQYYIGGSIATDDLTAWQLTSMDPDLDGDSDGVDISYLIKVIASKYRFLANFTHTYSPFALSSLVYDSSSNVVSSDFVSVSFEIGTSLNKVSDGMIFSTGTDASDTDDGVYVMAESDGTNFNVVASNVPGNEVDIGVVIMIETYDSNGDTSDDRKFAFYCTRLYTSCVSVYGDSSAAFLPYTTV